MAQQGTPYKIVEEEQGSISDEGEVIEILITSLVEIETRWII
jgi:hypothetical protein